VKLAGHNRIKLLWVPGHMETDGNEITDQSDKDGSSLSLRGPVLALGISASVARWVIRDWMSRKCKEQ